MSLAFAESNWAVDNDFNDGFSTGGGKNIKFNESKESYCSKIYY